MLSEEKKQQLRQEKKEKIIRIRKIFSDMPEEQWQAVVFDISQTATIAKSEAA